jgi:hypothetical protein
MPDAYEYSLEAAKHRLRMAVSLPAASRGKDRVLRFEKAKVPRPTGPGIMSFDISITNASVPIL